LGAKAGFPVTNRAIRETIPVEVVHAADDIMDIFAIYKPLQMDMWNASYWPERRTLKADPQDINVPTAVVALYHVPLREFVAYKIANDRGLTDEAQSFRQSVSKLEVLISQQDDKLAFNVERRCSGNRPFFRSYDARDEVMINIMGFIRETSPTLLTQIHLLEQAWKLDQHVEGIAFNL
jgi:hypothetical protein